MLHVWSCDEDGALARSILPFRRALVRRALETGLGHVESNRRLCLGHVLNSRSNRWGAARARRVLRTPFALALQEQMVLSCSLGRGTDTDRVRAAAWLVGNGAPRVLCPFLSTTNT